MTNENSGRNTGVPDFLLKMPVPENSPLVGESMNSRFLCASKILQKTIVVNPLTPNDL
jgi:hypothetical protein